METIVNGIEFSFKRCFKGALILNSSKIADKIPHL